MLLASSIILAGLVSARSAQSAVPMAVYGFVSRVVLEPNDKPERLQVWGVFSVAVPGHTGEYQAPERGYLYFQLPADSATAVSEWTELSRLAKVGFPGTNRVGSTIKGKIAAFGRPGSMIRVRTPDEGPDHADVYGSGNGVAVVSYDSDSPAVQMLGRLLKNEFAYNYVLVDRVVVQPETGEAQEIQIWGVFAMRRLDGSFAEPQKGYLYLKLTNHGPGYLNTLRQWNDWKAAAGTYPLAGFTTFNQPGLPVRLRPPDEKPEAPDAHSSISKDENVIRTDTEYRPVRALLEFRQ